MRLAGICATDREMVRGYYPFTGIMGHEFVGEVIKSPADPALEGQRVVGEINAACGKVVPRPLITAHYPLSQAEKAIQHAGQPGTFKILLSYDGKAE